MFRLNSKNTTKKVLKYGKILGVKVTSTKLIDVLTSVEDFISDSSKFFIATPNPELILMAQTNQKLKNALNSATLSIPDGVGLKLADSKLTIIKGRQLFLKLIDQAEKKDWKVFLLGGLDNEAGLAAEKLSAKYPKLKIEAFQGPELDNDANPVMESDKKLQKEAIDRINKFAPDLLFVAFGNPKQEIWIHENYQKLNIGGAMAVGGSFRYVTGLSKLPPSWMAKAGLEWLWRLITEPYRLGRVFRATIVFPIKFFLSKLD